MRQSNTYIIVFSAILTVILGGLLSLAAVGLGPTQKKAVELDTRRQILSAVIELKDGDDVLSIYNERIKSLVVNIDGDVVKKTESGGPIIAENVNIAKEFTKAPENRLYPVFTLKNANDTSIIDAYILPLYGSGLWDNIWGFIALEPDLTTIRGAKFDHAGETPGLGARITEIEVQGRFKGKKITDDLGELISVKMLKGENNDSGKLDDYHVDGMSGATITSNGVNNMLENYLKYYQSYLNKISDDGTVASLNK